MCRFIETIRVENGVPCLLPLHEERMNKTRRLCMGSTDRLSLADVWKNDVSKDVLMKWRVVYDEKNIVESLCTPYHPRKVRTLKLVTDNEIDYAYKSEDRSALNQCFELRGDADDVLVVRNGKITDTSIANVALFDGRQWWTPKYPLLRGVKRQFLLENGLVKERDIFMDNLSDYSCIRLFNAMLDWDEMELPIEAIKNV